MILEINEAAKPLLAFLGKLFNVIHIAIPILLIVFITIDLSKAILSQDDEMVSKTVRTVKNRVIASLAIFFLPTIVEVIFNNVFVALNMDEEEYKSIIESYKSIINSEEIVVDDESKNNAIKENMKYDLSNDSRNDFESEANILNISRTMTRYLFNENKPISSLNQFTTNDFVIVYNNKEYKLNDKFVITYEKLESKEVLFNENEIISSIILKNAAVNSKKINEISINYTYIKIDEKYKLSKVNIIVNSNVDDYIKQSKLNEKKDDITVTEKYVSSDSTYDYSKLNELSEKDIEKIYNLNSKNIVIINSIYDAAVVNRAVGFFLNNGVVATSWSFLKSSLMKSQSIIVSDIDNNTYNIDGVVAIDVVSDIVVVKLDKQVKKSIILSTNEVNKNDPVVTITSKKGIGLTSITGIVSSVDNSIISVLPLSRTDWGSPLFNSKGEVIGVNTSKYIDTELSNSSNVNGLIKLQKKLNDVSFKEIKVTSLEELKKEYYYKDKNTEEIKTSIPTSIWNKYKKIGDIENTIILDLIKASYYNKVVSLRYINETSNYLNNISFATDFISNLELNEYKKIYETKEKVIYKKGFNKVVIMSEFDYLIVIIANEGIL